MVRTRHGAITDPDPPPDSNWGLIDPHPEPKNEAVKSVAGIARKFQTSIELLSQRKVYPNDLSEKLMENAQLEIEMEIQKKFGRDPSETIGKLTATYKKRCGAIYTNYLKVDKKWMKAHPRAFHPSEPRHKYPTIKDDVWDVEEDPPSTVNRTLSLDKEIEKSPPVATEKSK